MADYYIPYHELVCANCNCSGFSKINNYECQCNSCGLMYGNNHKDEVPIQCSGCDNWSYYPIKNPSRFYCVKCGKCTYY